MSVEFISSSIHLASVRDHICPTLTFASFYSPPIPIFYKGFAAIAVLIGRGEYVNPGDGYQIWNPHLVSMFDSTGGAFLELRAVSMEHQEAPQVMGPGLSPQDKQAVPYINAMIKYCQTVDKVTETILTGQNFQDKQSLLIAAFNDVAESYLSPYAQFFLLNEHCQ